MDYVVLRKRRDFEAEGPQPAGAGGRGEAFSITVEPRDQLDDRDPSIDIKAPEMPMRLIEPKSKGGAAAAVPPVESWGMAAVKASASQFNGAGITVAVLDTGIQKNHPAFAGVELITKNFTKDADEDEHGHGTHCAGTIFGRDVDKCRIGIARGVSRALIGKVIGKDGTTASIVKAINWASAEGAQVISMSLGIDYTAFQRRLVQIDGYPDQIATSMAMAAYAQSVRLFDNLSRSVIAVGGGLPGTLLIAATGNESDREANAKYTVTLSPPAVGEGVVAVGALRQTGQPAHPYDVAGFSNIGPRIAAPGVDILSARLGGGLETMSGTSMATPHVAGVAALWAQRMREQGHPLSARGVVDRLERNAMDLPGLSYEDVGLGLVQAP